MLELFCSDAAIIACHASPSSLDQLAAPRGLYRARIAPDETWLVGPLESRGAIAERARAELGPANALVVDQTDGWTVWTVRGDGFESVLQRLMLAPIPPDRPAFVQGAITGVPGKVIAEGAAAHLFVPAPVGHHLRDRILSVLADQGPSEGPARPFAAATT